MNLDENLDRQKRTQLCAPHSTTFVVARTRGGVGRSQMRLNIGAAKPRRVMGSTAHASTPFATRFTAQSKPKSLGFGRQGYSLLRDYRLANPSQNLVHIIVCIIFRCHGLG